MAHSPWNGIQNRETKRKDLLNDDKSVHLDTGEQDEAWSWFDTLRTRYDPLKFMDFIEKIILDQQKYQQPFTIVYEQEVVFYSFHQHNLTNN